MSAWGAAHHADILSSRGIVNGESAEFSNDGQLIVTSSKADGRSLRLTGTPVVE